MAVRRCIALITAVILATASIGTAKPVAWTDLLSPAGTFDNNPNNFNILSTAVNYAGLTKAVLGLNSATVFAPTDAAFIEAARAATGYKGNNERVAYERLIRWAEDPRQKPLRGPALAKQVLLYHVVPYPMTKKHIVSNSYFVPTLSKVRSILLTKSLELVDGNPYEMNPMITKADVYVTNNNIVHVLNGILFP